LEEKLYDLVNNLLGKERGLLVMREKLPGLKSSTREEILKRLLVVTDYIQAHLPENLALDQLAAQGCLSKFHLLRLFKTAFGKTPHEFINEERVRRAKALLLKTNLEVHQIASAVGFRDSSSFSRMFYKHLGGYPTQVRQALV
jgi:AraC family transcriptional regulator